MRKIPLYIFKRNLGAKVDIRGEIFFNSRIHTPPSARWASTSPNLGEEPDGTL